MIAFIALVVFVWLAAFGATIFVDWLHAPRKPKRSTLPLARVLSRAEERRLEIPTAWRRQTLRNVVFCRPTRVIDVPSQLDLLTDHTEVR